MRLSSPAFEPDGSLPVRFAKDGEDVSPPIEWSDVPEGTRELALIFENTSESFVQWILYGIPPEPGHLPEGIRHAAQPERPAGVKQGTNGRGNVGYDGPLGTESRRYHYSFRLYALDQSLKAAPGLDREALVKAMRDHVLEEAELKAVYERPRG